MVPAVPRSARDRNRRGVPLRRGLFLRLLALTAVVSLFSIPVTVWLTVRTTAVAISREQGQILADDARIYDTLLAYAAAHRDWYRAASTVRELARDTGRRIVVTTDTRTPLVDSETTEQVTLPPRASARIDPLAADSPVMSRTGSDRIDDRAVGPFRLPHKEKQQLQAEAERILKCLREGGQTGIEVFTEPSGRPHIEINGNVFTPGDRCSSERLATYTSTERKALEELNTLVNTCLRAKKAPGVRLSLDFTWVPTAGSAVPDPATKPCVDNARRDQLTTYVAPSALLFIQTPSSTATTLLDLSASNRTRIAAMATLVLLSTVTVTALAGLRMVRPLRALTDAAEKMKDGDISARVTLRSRDEIGRLGEAFNAMSERREQLEEQRKAMVSDVAHELRTPLSNIRGWLEAVEDGIAVPDDEWVSSLLEEALLLQHVIDDLRDLAAAEAGELLLHKSTVHVGDLLAQVAFAQQGLAEASGISLATSVMDDVRVTADPVRLRQAIGNLISNAIRHTPPGGTVVVQAHHVGDGIAIQVQDTGSGIPPHEITRVFDRFWRADQSRSRQTGGSGLGLAIVRRLAEAHGGTATATSTLGTGSVFTLHLPHASDTSPER